MNKIFMFICLGTMIWFSSCQSNAEAPEEQTDYTATSPMTLDTSFTKEYVTQIKSVRNIEIRALEKGILQKIYVDEGQNVKQGQSLFKIMPKLLEAELLKAQAEAKSSEVELSDAKTLVAKNIVSKSEQSIAQAKLDAANAAMSSAKLHLSFTDIRAPFSGTIDRIPKKMGSLLDEGDLLSSLSDNSSVYAYFNVSEPEYLAYQTDVKNRGSKQVSLLLADGNIFPYKGEVEVIESEFDSETGNIAFRAKFPNNNQLLKNGQTGKVLMKVPLHQALIVPQKATYEVQDKKYVFVIDKNNVVSSRIIEIAGSLQDLYVIKSGVNAQDKILLEGVQKVKDGDKIKFVYQKPAMVMSNLKLKAE